MEVENEMINEPAPTSSAVMKGITGAFEILLAIPLLGAMIVMGTSYMALLVMFILHIVTLALSISNRGSIYGSVLGIITSLIAWIPFLGWMMHLITGILLLVSATRRRPMEE